MKIQSLLHPLLTGLFLGLSALAASAHNDEQKESGPNGGRLLTATAPRAEFFVTAERKVQITFLDADGKPVAPAGQVVTVTAGDRAAPTKFVFARSGHALLSDVALPAGNNVPTVVQIASAPGARVVTEKFNVSLVPCSECHHPEYACVCVGH